VAEDKETKAGSASASKSEGSTESSNEGASAAEAKASSKSTASRPKERSSKKDEDEASDREDEDETSDEKGDDADDDEEDEDEASDEKGDDADDDEEDEDEASDEKGEGEGDDADDDDAAADGERDESTKGVARALGVDEDEEEAEAEETAEEQQLNRAQRRREEAMKRRAAREGGGASKSKASRKDEAVVAKDTTEAKLPKDKNARAKELLRRRQESAAGKRVTKLDTSEMVQDSLARAGAATGRWVRDQWKVVVAVLVLGTGGAIATMVYFNHKEAAAAAASDALTLGLRADLGHVDAKGDVRQDEEKKFDPFPVYTSLAARADAAVASYEKVVSSHPGSGPAILARLGEAGALLEKGEWDKAINAYNEVAGSPLAAADADVKARAIEGVGLAKEGKGDFDGAIASFKDLEALGIKGIDDLGKYHQARMLLKKGDKDGAKTALVELQKKLELPSPDGTQSDYVKRAVNDYLRAIDPTLVKRPPSLGGLRGNMLTPEDLQNLDEEKLRKLQELLKHQGEGQQPGMPGLPGMPAPPGGEP
jgi:tetratricopeptide (TPR) repeat protein